MVSAKMTNKIDWNKYEMLIQKMIAAGVNPPLAKILVYEKLKNEPVEVYSPYETINS
jgi:hypothetical protein